MRIRFWGVRGSIPVPGPTTLTFGGNTACVSAETNTHVVVLDAGTGMKDLGLALRGDPRPIVVLTSHRHWDHIMGFPFFAPIWEPDREIHVVADSDGGSPLDLLDGTHFPKHHRDLPSHCRLVSGDGRDLLARWGFTLDLLPLSHPGGGWAYRLGHQGKSLTYITDHELDSPTPGATTFEETVEFARNTDVLCHDAQLAPEELAERCGWGHSGVKRVCELARTSGSQHLVLFHHDPMRDDAAVAGIEAEARAELADDHIEVTAAWEGWELVL